MTRTSALALALPVLALAAACGGSSAPTATKTVLETPAPAATSSSPAPSASSSSAPSSTAPSPTASASGGSSGAVVTGSGSRFTVPAAPTVKAYRAASSGSGPQCYGLVDAGYTYDACDRYTSKLGIAVALVETKGADERSLVYTVSGAKASLALRATRQLPSGRGNAYAQSGTEADVSDLSSDNTDKVVLLTPQGSSTDSLASVDVVEATGKVVLHRALAGGKARKALGGGLETFVPTSGGSVLDTIIRYRDGAWRVVSSKTVASSSVPDSGGF